MKKAWFKLLSRFRAVQEREEEGFALVEFALCLLVFFPLFFGIIQASLGLYSYMVVADSARSATRYAIVRGESAGTTNCSSDTWATCAATSTDIANYTKSLNYPLVNTSNYQVTTTWLTQLGTPCSTCNEAGDEVRVKVTYPYVIRVPLVMNTTWNLSSTSEMTIQH